MPFIPHHQASNSFVLAEPVRIKVQFVVKSPEAAYHIFTLKNGIAVLIGSECIRKTIIDQQLREDTLRDNLLQRKYECHEPKRPSLAQDGNNRYVLLRI